MGYICKDCDQDEYFIAKVLVEVNVPICDCDYEWCDMEVVNIVKKYDITCSDCGSNNVISTVPVEEGHNNTSNLPPLIQTGGKESKVKLSSLYSNYHD